MSDNLKIWDAVSKTNPANTKKVNQRGGFTSICAQSQVMEATRQFGPIGAGWGYDAGEPIFHDTLVFVRVTLWHGDRSNVFGPVTGGAEWKSNKGHLDSDAPKKATTDALTKLLSQLGFNADVFLGLYDDSKYVEAVKQEFANAAAADAPPAEKRAPDPTAKISDKTRHALQDLIITTGGDVSQFCRDNQLTSLADITNGTAAELAAPLKAKKKELA